MRQSQRLRDIHAEALLSYNKVYSSLRDERQQCIEDRRFYSIAGAQWEGKLGNQFENKPRLEINKVHLSIIKIFNEYRNNRITVDFVSKTGEQGDPLSSACDDLYRATEENSSAQEAYDNAFEEGVGGGFGAFRFVNEYEDEYDPENEKQVIKIVPIYDADTSVYFDLDAKEYDKSDAKFAFVVSSITHEEFMNRWGEDPSTWPKDDQTSYFDWTTIDTVYVAEFYRVEETTEKLYIYKSLDGEETTYSEKDFENDDTLEETLEITGYVFEKERKIKCKRIRKYLMSGNGILEDYGYIAGKNIPIIPFYGKRWFIDNIERCMGHVRLSKDIQRLKNMQTSKLAEISVLSTVEKPILTPEQVAGHTLLWSEDNIENKPFLLINPVTDADGNPMAAGPVGYTRVPNIPPAMAALLQITDTDMKEILGNQEQGEQIQSNLSGKAIELIQTRLDMQTFIYMSNMSKSIKRAGEVWLSMAQDVFVEEGRKLKGIGVQGEVNSIELMKPMMDKNTGRSYMQNDLSAAKFDVAVTVGPSSISKRESTIRSLTTMLQFTEDPVTRDVITSTIITNMEGEGIEQVKDFFRNKLIRTGAAKPTEEEAEQLAAELENQQPSAQDQYLQAEAGRADAEAAKNRADTAYTLARAEETQAKTDETKAKTLETLSGIESEDERKIANASQFLDGFGE